MMKLTILDNFEDNQCGKTSKTNMMLVLIGHIFIMYIAHKSRYAKFEVGA